MRQKVSIILVNYCGSDDTIACLDSLLAFNKGENIIVVDNASPDNSLQKLENYLQNKKYSTQVDIIASDKNKGFAAGMNLGIRTAQVRNNSHYFWLLNNDTTIESDVLPFLLKRYSSEPKLGILGAKMRYFDQPQILQGVGGIFNPFKGKIKIIGFNEEDKGQYNKTTNKVDYAIGASMFVSDAFIQEVGFLSEDYFLYYEELDWSIRAIKKGFYISYEPKCEVLHKEGRSTGNDSRNNYSMQAMYYIFRNLIKVYQKYYPYLLPIPIAVIVYRSLKLSIKRDRAYFSVLIKVLTNNSSNEKMDFKTR